MLPLARISPRRPGLNSRSRRGPSLAPSPASAGAPRVIAFRCCFIAGLASSWSPGAARKLPHDDPPSHTMRIAFVTHSLRPGGSERQLVVLSNALVAQGHDVVVVALRGGGALEHELDGAVGSYVIDTTGHWYLPAGWLRL